MGHELVRSEEGGESGPHSDYFRALFPGYRVERELLSQSEAVLAGYGDELPVLARMVREANDDLLRAIRCREFAAG